MTETNEELTPQEAEKVIENLPTTDNVVGDQGARVEEDEEDDFDDDLGEFDEDDEDFEDDDK